MHIMGQVKEATFQLYSRKTFFHDRKPGDNWAITTPQIFKTLWKRQKRFSY